MDEMLQMSQNLHIYSVIALISIVVLMIISHKVSSDFKAFTKLIKILMIFHLSFLAAVVLTGAILMAAQHLSLTPANLIMIVAVFIVAGLEIKRNKALAQVIKFNLMPKMTYIKLGYKYLLLELVLLIAVGGFSEMANAISF